jgi:hypothetical protein
MPTSEGRQREFFNLILPKLDDPSSDSQWFLAEQLGQLLADNPDFRCETLLAMVPQSFRHPLEEALWLPSTGWMLTYDTPIPTPGQPVLSDHRAQLRRFALDLFLKQLSPDADSRLRSAAIAMLYQPALRSHPEVAAAAARVDVGRFRQLLPDAFFEQVTKAAEGDPSESRLELTPQRLRNLSYFRDYVIPELSTINREDGKSCFSCHGSGNVPSLTLSPPERRSQYLSPKDVWTNYRTLLERIDVDNVEQSKLVRKPLNVLSGEEDGHQGGMRYRPGDRGHEILKRWAQDAAQVDRLSDDVAPPG